MRLHRSSSLPFLCLLTAALLASASEALADPAPRRLLDLPGADADPERIDYDALPRLEGSLAVVQPAELDAGQQDAPRIDLHHLRFRLHSYLLRHNGRLWCIWSDGPPIEDEPTQEVRFATSEDGGLTWSRAKSVTGTPEAPHAFIARGLWAPEGELLALAAHFKGKGAFGAPEQKELRLQAYAWNESEGRWRFKETLFDNAINNFPPQRLPSGDWIMTRRDTRFNVSVLIGGRKSLNDWKAFSVAGRFDVPDFSPDEPILWTQPDNTLTALFRNNGKLRRLFHATSADQGRTWSLPAPTNLPDAGSKLFSMQTSRGYRVLVSNARPQVGRRELYLSVSRDGETFIRMARLAVPSPPPVEGLSQVWRKFGPGIASLQYPHVIEEDGHLLIAFSRNKKQIEALRVALDAIDELLATSEGDAAGRNFRRRQEQAKERSLSGR